MLIECVPSSLGGDVRCAVCGQGFVISGDVPAAGRGSLSHLLQNALGTHHRSRGDAGAHPQDTFRVPLAPTDYFLALV